MRIPVFAPTSPWPADERHAWKKPGVWIDGEEWSFSRSPSPPPMVESPPLRRTPSPRQPLVEQIAPDDLSPPRHSGRTGRPVNRPDNVYRNRPPVDILADNDDDPFLGNTPPGNQSPGPSGDGSGNNQPIDNPSMFADLVKMAQDGGADLINFLLRASASSTVAKGKIPDVSKVREWQYRDLMRLPKAVQEEWKIACKEELEALHQRNIFKLTDLPKGRRTIGCRWVFDVKSDGRKKASVRGHPVSHDNRPRIETFQSAHPCSDDAIVTSHNRSHIKISQSAPFCRDNGVVTSHNRPHIEISRSAPFFRDNGVVTSHNRPHIEIFRSAGPYIPPHHHPTFASQVRPHIEIFQSAGPHTPS